MCQRRTAGSVLRVDIGIGYTSRYHQGRVVVDTALVGWLGNRACVVLVCKWYVFAADEVLDEGPVEEAVVEVQPAMLHDDLVDGECGGGDADVAPTAFAEVQAEVVLLSREKDLGLYVCLVVKRVSGDKLGVLGQVAVVYVRVKVQRRCEVVGSAVRSWQSREG